MAEKTDATRQDHNPRNMPAPSGFPATQKRCSIRQVHHRYFENPFHTYTGLPLRNPEEYQAVALELFRDIYHHYSGENLQTSRTDVYTGSTGVAFTCSRLLSMSILSDADRQMAVRLGSRIMDSALRQRTGETGFLIGDAGVVAVGALFYSSARDHRKAEECLTEYAKLCANVDRMVVDDSTGDELFAGRIGYLDGFLELWKCFPSHKTLLQTDVSKIIGAVLKSGTLYSRKKHLEADSPLFFYHYAAHYLGAAHGSTTILQFLLCFPKILHGFEGAKELVKKSIDYVLQQQTKSGNFLPKFGERDSGREELVHWCHGAPGVIYMLAKAYMVYKDKRYLDAASVCADLIWEKGLLRKGPGICHGISGNGYAFLLMYRLTKNEEYLYRAHCFADFMFQSSVQDKSRTPDHPYSLFEGGAGSVCFLIDLTSPVEACFPFCDVFTEFSGVPVDHK